MNSRIYRMCLCGLLYTWILTYPWIDLQRPSCARVCLATALASAAHCVALLVKIWMILSGGNPQNWRDSCSGYLEQFYCVSIWATVIAILFDVLNLCQLYWWLRARERTTARKIDQFNNKQYYKLIRISIIRTA